jgi:hypothetical protein
VHVCILTTTGCTIRDGWRHLTVAAVHWSDDVEVVAVGVRQGDVIPAFSYLRRLSSQLRCVERPVIAAV